MINRNGIESLRFITPPPLIANSKFVKKDFGCDSESLFIRQFFAWVVLNYHPSTILEFNDLIVTEDHWIINFSEHQVSERSSLLIRL